MRDRITVRMTDEMLARIDAWIAGQAGYVTRQEAVRCFVGFSLKHIDRPPADCGHRNAVGLRGGRVSAADCSDAAG